MFYKVFKTVDEYFFEEEFCVEDKAFFYGSLGSISFLSLLVLAIC